MDILRRIGLLGLALLALVITVGIMSDDKPPTPSAPPASVATAPAAPAPREMSRRFLELRDEGIQNVGWLAGNARGHPIWPQVRGFVEPGGVYYDAFMLLSSGRGMDEVDAAQNLALFNKWKERGASTGFDEAEGANRIRRMIAIAEELRDEIAKAR